MDFSEYCFIGKFIMNKKNILNLHKNIVKKINNKKEPMIIYTINYSHLINPNFNKTYA